MADSSTSHREPIADADPGQRPEIAVCESAPGTSVFLESGNTDGWIASDVTVDATR